MYEFISLQQAQEQGFKIRIGFKKICNPDQLEHTDDKYMEILEKKPHKIDAHEILKHLIFEGDLKNNQEFKMDKFIEDLEIFSEGNYPDYDFDEDTDLIYNFNDISK